jgi:NADH dehydrogenase
MGVEITLNTMIKSYNGKTAKLSTGKSISTETLIWAAGVKGALVKGFPDKSIEKGKLMVNQFSQVLKNKEKGDIYENIFAVGDIACMKTEKYKNGHPGLAQAAIQQGKTLARNLNRMKKGKPRKGFHYKNKGVLATVGRNKALAELPGNINVYGTAGWFVWMIVHLLFLVI